MMLKRFLRNDTGSLAIMVSVAMFFIIAIVAASVNMSQVQTGSVNNDSANDAAALATAEWILKAKLDKIGKQGYEGERWKTFRPSDTEIRNYAYSVFKQNAVSDQSNSSLTSLRGGTGNFQVTFDNAQNKVKINSCLFVRPIEFAKVVGQGDEKEVCSTSYAGFTIENTGLKDMEIAFSMDVSGSMIDRNRVHNANDKFAKLIGAMTALTNDDRYLKDAKEKNIRYSLIPHLPFISVGPYKDKFIDPNIPNFYEGLSNSSIISVSQDKLRLPSSPENLMQFPQGSFYTSIKGTNGHKSKGEVWLQNWAKNMQYYGNRPEFAIQPLTYDLNIIRKLLPETKEIAKGVSFYAEGQKGGDYNSTNWFGRACGSSGLSGLYGAWMTVSPKTTGMWAAKSFAEQNNPVTPIRPYNAGSSIPSVKKLRKGGGVICTNSNRGVRYEQGDPNCELGFPNIDSYAKYDIYSRYCPGRSFGSCNANTQLTSEKITYKIFDQDPEYTASDRADRPSPAGSVRKIIIHMTDALDNDGGRNCDTFYSPTVVSDVANDYRALCDKIRADGIDDIYVFLYNSTIPGNIKACIPADKWATHVIKGVTADNMDVKLKELFDQEVAKNVVSNVKLLPN